MQVFKAITHLKDFKTDGHKPALVLADNGLKYVVKPCMANGFDYCIYSELLAHFLLKLWQIQTPEIALIKVEKELLNNSDNAKHYKTDSFKNLFFGSQFIENNFELNNFLSFAKKIDYKKIWEPEKLIQLGLFDLWVENDDRKPSNFNILLDCSTSKFAIVAIDNACIFSTLNYSQLNSKEVSQSFNDNLLY